MSNVLRHHRNEVTEPQMGHSGVCTPAVLYGAKSTEDKRASIPTQLADGRALAEREGWEVVGEYQDEAASAYSGNRGDGLAQAKAHATRLADEGHEPMLIVQHSDRLARGDGVTADHLVELALWARKAHVGITSVQDPMTFEGGLAFAAMLGDRNYEDSRRKALATRDGLRRAAERGEWVGGICPDGYRLERGHDERGRETKTVVFDSDRQHIYRLVWDLALNGYSAEAIELECHRRGFRTEPKRRDHRPRAFDANRVRQTLDNPFYAGLSVYRKEVVGTGHWQGYVTPEDFYRLQAERRERCHYTKRKVGRPKTPVLLARLATCGKCGAKLDIVGSRYIRKDGTSKRDYECRAHREHHRHSDMYCSSPPFNSSRVDPAVIANLDSLLGDVERWREQLQAGRRAERERLTGEAQRAQADMAESDRKIKRMTARYDKALDEGDEDTAEAVLDALVQRRAEGKRAQTRLDAALDALSASSEVPEAEDAEKVAAQLYVALSGRVADADEDVKALNLTLREFFERFELTHTPNGIRIVPVLSGAAVARILRDPARWPHDVTVTHADGHETAAVGRATLEDAERLEAIAAAVAHGKEVPVTLGIQGPPPFGPDDESGTPPSKNPSSPW